METEKNGVAKKRSQNHVNKERLVAFLRQKNRETSSSEICRALEISRTELYSLVASVRRDYLNNVSKYRVWTGRNGYSLTRTKSTVIHEAEFRSKMISGLTVNSIPVFDACEAVASVEFKRISFEFGSRVENRLGRLGFGKRANGKGR